MNFELLETPNLILRKLTPETYEFVFHHYSDTDLKTFFGFATDEDLDKEKEKLIKGLSTHNRSFVKFQILDKETKEVVGACGFHNWYAEHSRAEVGYDLKSEKHMGKGIMTEALRAVIDYGFMTMNLNRIEAFISPKNEASLRLVEKMNFIKEGHLRQHYCKNNVMEDSVVYSLLRAEYKLQ